METPVMTVEDCGLPPLALAGGQELGGEAHQERRLELEHLLANNLPRFRRLAMRWLRNPEDAEDAVQDAVLSAFKHIARFEGRAQMSTWLMAIVINAVRMQIRRRPRQQIVSLDQLSKDTQCAISDLIADPRPTPEQTLQQRELRALANKLADSLPVAQRAAMQLRDGDDLSTSEAAEALGVPEGTLKAQLARGRSKLTQRLRRALGMQSTRTSNSDSKARHKALPASSWRREPEPGDVPLRVFGFEEQGGSASWMGA
jgi:RNA polymerase sigma-70 factor, ECF subfamily